MRGPLTPAEFVPMWMSNHGVTLRTATKENIIQMLKDFMTDWDSPVRRLVEKIYNEPDLPSETWRRTYHAGFYSIRDTEEFQRVAKLTKLS